MICGIFNYPLTFDPKDILANRCMEKIFFIVALYNTYGFIYIDKNDDSKGMFKRYRKDSFEWYKKVLVLNGKPLNKKSLVAICN